MTDARGAPRDHHMRGMVAPRQPTEEPHRPASAPIILAICGDPVVGRALVLLLRGARYDARFLPTSSLSEPGALEGVQLVLLTPAWELNVERREVHLTTLRSASGPAEAPILELTTSPGEGTRNGAARVGSEHTVAWPCSTEELERRIEAALLTRPGESSGPVGPATSERAGG
jgi:DNA-binding response OmpR family regulator